MDAAFYKTMYPLSHQIHWFIQNSHFICLLTNHSFYYQYIIDIKNYIDFFFYLVPCLFGDKPKPIPSQNCSELTKLIPQICGIDYFQEACACSCSKYLTNDTCK